MNYVSKKKLLSLLTAAGVCILCSNADAVTISSISTLPLSNSTYDDGASNAVTYQNPNPSGLVVNVLVTTGPNNTSSRGVRSPRNNAQSFTIDAGTYPTGVDMTAFVMHFEKRGDATDTFGIELFSVANANTPYSNSPPLYPAAVGTVTNLLTSVSSLTFPTATSLGVTTSSGISSGDSAAGTAIFNFDTPLYLAPGAYVWRFVPSWTDSTSNKFFDWDLGPSYSGGRRYEADAASGSSTSMSFGVIGTAAVPEPTGLFMIGVSAFGLGLAHWRKKM